MNEEAEKPLKPPSAPSISRSIFDAPLVGSTRNPPPQPLPTTTSDISSGGDNLPPKKARSPPQSVPIRRKRSRNDFNFGECLGRGAFGEVYAVQYKTDGKWYAMKILNKSHIFKEKKSEYVKIERDAMNRLQHDNIIRLTLTFQDSSYLYYVVELAQNGDIAKVLNKYVAIAPESGGKIILAQILTALGYMHHKRVLHRDIKPENVLLDSSNRVKISDFGTAKLFDLNEEKFAAPRGSFVGSADYVSPEVLKETTIGPMSDIWSFGCLIYTFFVGEAPFHTDSNYQTFQRIQNIDYKIPDFVPEDAKDLIQSILILDPEKRLGHSSYDDQYSDIKSHRFFAGIDWKEVPKMEPPPWESFEPALLSHHEKIAEKMKKDGRCEEAELEDHPIRECAVKTMKDGKMIDGFVVLTNRPRIYLTTTDSESGKNVIFNEVPITPTLKAEICEDDGGKIVINNGDKHFEFFADQKVTTEWKELIDTVLLEL